MSGGSYDYLCHKDFSDIWGARDQIQRMADRLSKLGYADDAAAETMEVLLELRQAKNRIETRMARLTGVWRGVEWMDSFDASEEDFKEQLKRYRHEDQTPKT